MSVIVLAVFLSVAQTSVPVPRQAANNPAGTRANIKNQGQNKDAPTNSSHALVNQDQAKTPDGNDGKQSSKDTEGTISISKLPSVTVLPAKRDLVDWAYWGFSGLLVLVGAFQIWVLWKTLKISKRQADIAHNQEIQMMEAGGKTERIIAQMRDTAERELRAYVGVSKVFFDPGPLEGRIETENFGKTPAHKVRQWAGIAVYPHPLKVALPGSSGITSISVLHPGVKHANVVPVKKPLPDNLKIGTPEATVYVWGEIIYEDAFGHERHTWYRFIYGGPEGTHHIRDENGYILGVMNPDTEGNEAD